MADALKDMYHQEFFEDLARKVASVYPSFDEAGFMARVFAPGWDELALKQRMRRAAEALAGGLPANYGEALDIALAAADRCGSGFAYMLFPDFVEAYGLSDPDRSIPALARLTPYSSSEFAVRPFIVNEPDRMLGQLMAWAEDENEHVRRLASEGSRPRLPWGIALQAFKRDPTPLLPLLERLKEDPSEYVRRSVANHLNDISKDHPSLVLDLARRWLGRHPHTDWIVKHACRTLLKRCDPEALGLFGFAGVDGVRATDLRLVASEVPWGGVLEAEFRIRQDRVAPAALRIEYAIDYVKANGKQSRKLFKLSEREYAPGTATLSLRQSLRDLTTRKHYPGEHGLAIIVNGTELAAERFSLLPKPKKEDIGDL
ncbi:DNA alkylation repair protein [Paenibacillus sp. TRM 82003]|nr:DNA alkylation repair protein [Paenibacillus sp. TRM 82003]